MNEYYFDGYKVTELSYFDYKNLVKNLLTEDIEVLNNVFNDIFNKHIDMQNKSLSLYDKFKLIIFLRSLILGEELQIEYKDKSYILDINYILKNANIINEEIETDLLIFKTPTSFYIKDFTSEVLNSIKSIKINDKNINVEKFNSNEKIELFNEITDDNLMSVYNRTVINLQKSVINFLDLELSVYNGDIILLFKNIFNTDLNNLYDFEYNLIRHLNINSQDFKNYSYSELKIFYNKLIKENKDNNKREEKTIGHKEISM